MKCIEKLTKKKLPWELNDSRMTDSQRCITHVLDSNFSVILLTIEIVWSKTIVDDTCIHEITFILIRILYSNIYSTYHLVQ